MVVAGLIGVSAATAIAVPALDSASASDPVIESAEGVTPDPELAPMTVEDPAEPTSSDSSDTDTLVDADSATDPAPATDPAVAVNTEPINTVSDDPKGESRTSPVSMDFTFQLKPGQDATRYATQSFDFSGLMTCTAEVGSDGCVDPVLTVPIPDVTLPEGAVPFKSWGIGVYTVTHPTWNLGHISSDGKNWVFDLPSMQPGANDTLTLQVKQNYAYVVQNLDWTLTPTLSGANFDPVTPAGVTRTAIADPPKLDLYIDRKVTNTFRYYPGAVVTFHPEVDGLSGGVVGNTQTYAAIEPGSGVVTITLPDSVQFISSSGEDGDVAAEWDAASRTITYKDLGLTWAQSFHGETQTLAPFTFKINNDYTQFDQDIVLQADVDAKTIANDPEPVSADTTEKLKINETLLASDVVFSTVNGTGGQTGNRTWQTSGPLPNFAGQTVEALTLRGTGVAYDYDATLPVPCSVSTSPCPAASVRFIFQDLWIGGGSGDLTGTATLTRANGETFTMEIGSQPTPIPEGDSPVVSVNIKGSIPATDEVTKHAYLDYAGVFPESATGTSNFKWTANVKAATASDWSSTTASTSRSVSSSTGTAVRLFPTASSLEIQFYNYLSSNAGTVEGAVLLPAGVEYQGPYPGSDSAEPNEVIENWNSSGMTMLRFAFDSKAQSAKYKYSWKPVGGGRFEVLAAVNAGTDKFSPTQCANSQGPQSQSAGYGQYNKTSGGLLTTEPNGACLNDAMFTVTGDLSSMVFNQIASPTAPNIWYSSPGLWWHDADKHPEGVDPSDTVTLRTNVQNFSMNESAMVNPVVYVTLPTGVDGNPLGSKFTMNMTDKPFGILTDAKGNQALATSKGWTMAYSTSETPCQPELGIETDCDAWLTSAPSDMSTVRSLRFAAPSLASKASVYFNYEMQIPDLAELGDDYLDKVAWSRPVLAYTTADSTDVISLNGPKVGVGNFVYNPVYADVSAEVVGQDRDYARSGDKILFTEKLTHIDNGMLDPDVKLNINVPDLGSDPEAFENSIQASAGTATFDASTGVITWLVPSVEEDETLTFEVDLGDNPPVSVEATASATSGYENELAPCPEDEVCASEANVFVPQVWAALSSTPVSGSEVALGDTISFTASLNFDGVDLDTSALPDPTLTWDVSDLAKYGEITQPSVTAGTASYDEATETMTWHATPGLTRAQAAQSLTFDLKIADSAADISGLTAGEPAELSTELAATVSDTFTPVHIDDPLKASFTLVTEEEPEEPGPTPGGGGEGSEKPGPTPGGSGGSEAGAGAGSSTETSKPNGLANTGAAVTGVAAMALLLLGAGTLLVVRRRIN